jgi:release factor glutamine methyltransferase
MHIQQALQQASRRLAESSPSAALDAQVLLSHVLQCNSAHLAAWPEKKLTDEQQKKYDRLVKQRQQGLPVAHLTGQREFWSLNFAVDNSTLIPRPETETLIDFILTHFGDRKDLKLLDMGTGTGAIAIAVANEKPGWQIVASDISPQALRLAQQNSHNLQVENIRFILSNWFANSVDKDFDLIVSNPPYIAADDPHLSQGDVRFEPATALVSGNSGMADIEHICRQAKDHLAKNGWLVVEHGYNQQQQVADCFAKNGFVQITQQRDLSGHIRMSAGRYSKQ